MINFKNNIKKQEPVDLSNKNLVISINLYDNKDGSLHGQFHVTSAYFNDDMQKLNRIITKSVSYLRDQLVEEDIILISTIH
jgi:hypothetical protein